MTKSVLAIGLSVALAACSQQNGSGGEQAGEADFASMSAEEHLECAVAISAFSYLQRDGNLPEDSTLPKDGLVAMMWHHNAYAIDNDVREQDMADIINRAREDLISERRPEEIFEQARACAAATPDA